MGCCCCHVDYRSPPPRLRGDSQFQICTHIHTLQSLLSWLNLETSRLRKAIYRACSALDQEKKSHGVQTPPQPPPRHSTRLGRRLLALLLLLPPREGGLALGPLCFCASLLLKSQWSALCGCYYARARSGNRKKRTTRTSIMGFKSCEHTKFRG